MKQLGEERYQQECSVGSGQLSDEGRMWRCVGRSSAWKRSCQLWKWFVFIWFLTNTELESTTAKMGMDTNFCQQRKGRMGLKDKKKQKQKQSEEVKSLKNKGVGIVEWFKKIQMKIIRSSIETACLSVKNTILPGKMSHKVLSFYTVRWRHSQNTRAILL